MPDDVINDYNELDVERPQNQPSELTKKAQVVEAFCDEGLRDRLKYERQWYINMAFFMGYQWIDWNTIARRIYITYDPNHRRRVTVNKVMPATMKEVGRMTNQRPKFFVVPDEPTQDCKEIARMAEDLLDSWNRSLKIPLKNQDLLMQMGIYGSVFKDIGWDAFAGELAQDPISGGEINIGEIGQEILNLFEIVPQVGCTEMQYMQKVCIVKSRSLQWIKKQYPEWGYLVKSESDRAISSVEQQVNTMLSGGVDGSDNRSGDDKTGFANVKQYRELPSEQYRQGRVIITANKVFLAETVLPLQWQIRDKHLGLLKYDFIKIPGRFYGQSPIEVAIAPQVEYNKTLSQMIEHRNMCKAKFIKCVGHNIKTSINSEVGQIIEYTPVPGMPEPHWVNVPPLPAYVENILDRCSRDIQDIFSQHEISRGQTPPGVTANVAIETLSELDSTQYSSVHERYDNVEAEAAMMMLKTAKEKYTEPRKIAIVSADEELQVKYFDKAQDLPTKIIVQKGSSLGLLKTVKMEKILQLADRGIIDKNDRGEILKMLEFGSLLEKTKELNLDKDRAHLENSRITEETPLIVEVFDNHEIHIETHNNYRKTTEYERLLPEQKQKIDIHTAEHGARIAEAMQAQAMQNMPLNVQNMPQEGQTSPEQGQGMAKGQNAL